MLEIKINSYDELIQKIKEYTSLEHSNKYDNLSKYYFRGHSNKDWKLIPNILRGKNNCEQHEMKNSTINLGDIKLSLALAQHYGKKTRCLDFTRNYRVALFFACNPFDKHSEDDGALIIYRTYSHKPEWFTNYMVYYTATHDAECVSSWDFSEYLISKKEILDEFIRTNRSTNIDEVNTNLQCYLGQGFMVDFEDYKQDIRIKNQEAALFYFGSEYFEYGENNKIIVKKDDFHSWSGGNRYYINLHKLFVPNFDERCIKFIIPKELKIEIYDKINIKAHDLGL